MKGAEVRVNLLAERLSFGQTQFSGFVNDEDGAEVRIYDCFIFFNELDLLEIRLEELYDVVDYFVLCEARQTFLGKDKPLFFEENKERFSRFSDKIIHLIVDHLPSSQLGWENEYTQREYLITGLSAADRDDIIILSDIDEIPRNKIVQSVKRAGLGRSEVLCLQLRWFFYFINLERNEPWVRAGPRIVRKFDIVSMVTLRRDVRAPIQGMRGIVRWLRACIAMRKVVKRRIIENAGWHFTWLGGAEAVALKAASISRHVYDSKEPLDKTGAQQRIHAAISSSGPTPFSVVGIDDNFPVLVLKSPERFSHLIFDPSY